MWRTVCSAVATCRCTGMKCRVIRRRYLGTGDGCVSFHSWQQTQGRWVRSQIFGVEVISSSCHSSVSNVKHLPDTCVLLHRWRQVKIDKYQLVHVPLVCSASVPVLLLWLWDLELGTKQCKGALSAVPAGTETTSLFYCKETGAIYSKLSAEWYSHFLTIPMKDVWF